MDNSSSNNTAMNVLQRLLAEKGIIFRKDIQRIWWAHHMYQSSLIWNFYRCFPHIINLAVGDAIAALKKPNESPPPSLPDDGVTWEEFSAILQGDVIAKCRNIVCYCRASGNWQAELLQIIQDGNKQCSSGSILWHEPLRVVELLQEVATRWSSTFWMVDCILELRDVCAFNGSELSPHYWHDFYAAYSNIPCQILGGDTIISPNSEGNDCFEWHCPSPGHIQYCPKPIICIQAANTPSCDPSIWIPCPSPETLPQPWWMSTLTCNRCIA